MAEDTSDVAAGKVVAHALRKRGMKGILPLMAERGQIVELLCEMPECYCPKGRGYFDKKSNPMKDWAPNVDHSPTPKWKGGKLETDNVRLAHVRCNNTDHGWRKKIGLMVAAGKPLQEIADALNAKKVPLPRGQKTWTAANVRRAFVS
jgi:recombinase